MGVIRRNGREKDLPHKGSLISPQGKSMIFLPMWRPLIFLQLATSLSRKALLRIEMQSIQDRGRMLLAARSRCVAFNDGIKFYHPNIHTSWSYCLQSAYTGLKSIQTQVCLLQKIQMIFHSHFSFFTYLPLSVPIYDAITFPSSKYPLSEEYTKLKLNEKMVGFSKKYQKRQVRNSIILTIQFRQSKLLVYLKQYVYPFLTLVMKSTDLRIINGTPSI